ncbi:MAG: hypothetical protein FJY77_03500 [Candidatus Altiarchaeales archaeon]|nr:hypothetical protein [Candidatus Altiarchaeales archaeon]
MNLGHKPGRQVQNVGRLDESKELPQPLPAEVEAYLTKISGPLRQAINTLRDFKDQRIITRFYLTGSFATGHLKVPAEDIDFVVSLSNSVLRAGMGSEPPEMKEICDELDRIGRQAGTRFEVNFFPFGRVYRVQKDGGIRRTAEVLEEEMLDNISPEAARRKILLDLMDTDTTRPDFFIRLYQSTRGLNIP